MSLNTNLKNLEPKVSQIQTELTETAFQHKKLLASQKQTNEKLQNLKIWIAEEFWKSRFRESPED